MCVYQATSKDMVREHADCADLPAHEVIPVAEVIVVAPDAPGIGS